MNSNPIQHRRYAHVWPGTDAGKQDKTKHETKIPFLKR